MNSLPRVTEYTRERVSREFDDLGPQVCVADILQDLRNHNPELLDMALKCARDVDEGTQALVGFCMFYRLLIAQSMQEQAQPSEARTRIQLSPLPRVTQGTRDLIVREIDASGSHAFTLRYIEKLEHGNPELLQMAHDFASRHEKYLAIMQGMTLLWASLLAQAQADRAYMQ